MNAAIVAIVTLFEYWAFDAMGVLADPALGLIASVAMLLFGVMGLTA